jgi:hypothetical protein
MMATRLYTPEQFSMTAGVNVPFDLALIEDLYDVLPASLSLTASWIGSRTRIRPKALPNRSGQTGCHAAWTRRVSAAGLAPISGEVGTRFQSDSSRTDSPVRVLTTPASQSSLHLRLLPVRRPCVGRQLNPHVGNKKSRYTLDASLVSRGRSRVQIARGNPATDTRSELGARSTARWHPKCAQRAM